MSSTNGTRDNSYPLVPKSFLRDADETYVRVRVYVTCTCTRVLQNVRELIELRLVIAKENLPVRKYKRYLLSKGNNNKDSRNSLRTSPTRSPINAPQKVCPVRLDTRYKPLKFASNSVRPHFIMDGDVLSFQREIRSGVS